MYDHIPWLPHFSKHIPGAGRDLKRFREAAIQRASERYDASATSKDLFYYLVCSSACIPKLVAYIGGRVMKMAERANLLPAASLSLMLFLPFSLVQTRLRVSLVTRSGFC